MTHDVAVLSRPTVLHELNLAARKITINEFQVNFVSETQQLGTLEMQ